MVSEAPFDFDAEFEKLSAPEKIDNLLARFRNFVISEGMTPDQLNVLLTAATVLRRLAP